jgi:hypothetical protein
LHWCTPVGRVILPTPEPGRKAACAARGTC